jgi:hypothetical protein
MHLYAPFNGGAVAATVRVKKSAPGSCWTSSLSEARPDAFRCFVGNYIYDPCFANETISTNFVLCPLYTPMSRVLRINLTKPLPSNRGGGDPTRTTPWAIQLQSGKWCELITGATGEIAGMRINYGCTGGAILIGNPRRTSPNWTIFYAPSYKAGQYRPVVIRSAWW